MMPLHASTGFAQLPMYDWPEIRTATDALWTGVHIALSQRGIGAPDRLDRDQEPESAWRSPGLLLSQTCGLPLVQRLRGQVAVLGSFAFNDLLPSGYYHSVIIVRSEEAVGNVESLRGKRAAVNLEHSYSGCLALKQLVAPLAGTEGFFADVVITGSHRDSVQAVAEGLADTAAIDRVSWALARRFEPSARTLKVVATTDNRPGLPLITAMGKTPQVLDALRAALGEAVGTLDPASRNTLGITGFVSADDHDYDIFADDLQRFGTTALGPRDSSS